MRILLSNLHLKAIYYLMVANAKNNPQSKCQCIIGRKKATQNGLIIQCPKCRNTTCIFYNSIFLWSKLPVSTTLHIIYAWSVQMNRNLVFTNFYQACIYWLKVEGQPRIGGEAITVNVDETVISKPKYNRGRLIK